MEYIIVKASEEDHGQYTVLINGEDNGVTGSKITLDISGYISVAALNSGLKEKIVNVKNTTIRHPMLIELYKVAL